MLPLVDITDPTPEQVALLSANVVGYDILIVLSDKSIPLYNKSIYFTCIVLSSTCTARLQPKQVGRQSRRGVVPLLNR